MQAPNLLAVLLKNLPKVNCMIEVLMITALLCSELAFSLLETTQVNNTKKADVLKM